MSYIGTQPNNVKKNIGLYTPNAITALTKEGSWGGSMELIQSQTASGAVVNFTNLGNYNYDVHFVTFFDVMLPNDTELLAHRLSNNNGSSFISTNYHYAIWYGSDSGGFGTDIGTTKTVLSTLGASGNDTGEVKNGYVYYYNLLNSSKYSYCTEQTYSKASVTEVLFGGGVYPTAETHNAISFTTTGGSAITSGTFNLYGVKQL